MSDEATSLWVVECGYARPEAFTNQGDADHAAQWFHDETCTVTEYVPVSALRTVRDEEREIDYEREAEALFLAKAIREGSEK
ncbi:MAG: hypothetical protein DRQ89_14420 [Epsilonproteobacteria bacterium]|nr:MAG: hypothetical protein DRQ89_14420 [Campylobacterota bacterium]